MSLILDALRKSETERRRGQVPDLHAELPPLVRATVAPRRRWPLWFAGAAVLLGTLALGWSLWASRSATPTDAAAVQMPVVEPAPARAAALPVAASALPATPPATLVPEPTAVPAASPARAEPVADGVDRIASAAPTPAVVSPTAVPPAASPSTQITDARYDDAIAKASPPAPAAVTAPSVTPPMTPPSAGSTVRVADLSPGEREQLPALKVSMHMWGPTPEQRFAIIDGTRVGQGDRVGEAVVEEIVADGVVLNWHGRRLSLPLR